MKSNRQKMTALFNVEIDKSKLSPEVRTSLYIKDLKTKGFTIHFRSYLNNYTGTVALFYKNFKDAYLEFVIKQGWSESKFTDVLLVLARDKKFLSFKAFIAYGSKSDRGELHKSAYRELKEMERALVKYNEQNGGFKK